MCIRDSADGVDAYLVEFAICFKMHVPFGGPGRRIAAVKDVLQPLAVSGRKKRVKFFRRPGNLGGRQADEAYAVRTDILEGPGIGSDHEHFVDILGKLAEQSLAVGDFPVLDLFASVRINERSNNGAPPDDGKQDGDI